jgi:cytochrome c oxidase assembly protein subunit 15
LSRSEKEPVSDPARAGFQRLAIVTVVCALLLVAVGGAVRATDSGLACPTWPGCFSAGDFLPPRDLNVWLEHSHRLIAGVVALLVAAQAVWALARYRHRPGILWPALIAAVAVVLQAGLGAIVVLNLLAAELVTAHLGLAMLVVACLLVIAVNATPAPRTGPPRDPFFMRAAAAVSALTLVQILVGGHVTGIAAGLAFTGPEFPFLGVVAFGPVESASQAYNVAHRVLAVALAAAVMWLLAQARRTGQTGWRLQLPRIAAWLVVVQVAIGVGNLATQLSFVTVIPHLAVASWLWAALALTTFLAYRDVRAAAPERVPENRAAALDPVRSS